MPLSRAGTGIEMKPFLTLPFDSKTYRISGGWFYKPRDLITKTAATDRHFGIDFDLERKTLILAAAPGWAISSYHHYLVRQKEDRRRFVRHKGKLFGVGQGSFVIIYHPKQKLFTQYGHLDKINPSIPFYKPKRKRALVQPPVEKFQPHFFNKKNARQVKRGEVIGWAGISGMIGGWGRTHLHFEIYRYRDKEGGKPEDSCIDPYDIYKTSYDYPWPGHRRPVGERCLWNLGKDRLPKHVSTAALTRL